jgi:hypothetical protein
MTHREACDALAANTAALMDRVIDWTKWSTEVERILDARYPSERVRRAAPDGEWLALDRANRTSNALGSRLPGASRRLAARRVRAGETGGS